MAINTAAAVGVSAAFLPLEAANARREFATSKMGPGVKNLGAKAKPDSGWKREKVEAVE